MSILPNEFPLHDRLALLLRAHRTIRFCNDWLALRTGAFPRDVQDAVVIVGHRYGFHMTTGRCSDCLQSKAVVYARAA